MTQPMRFLRFLLWLLAAALIVNAALVGLAYGDGDTLGIAGFLLALGLALTHDSVGSRLRGRK